MLCPEVTNFPAPGSLFDVKKFEGKVPFKDCSISNFYFNHMVTVFVPDSLRLPENLTEGLIEDCDYYQVLDLSLSGLIDTKFISSFTRCGQLTLLSIGTRIDCDNCIAITPTGQLVLSLDRDTYQSLGIEGKLSHYTSKIKTRYIVTVDLKDAKLLKKDNLTKLKCRLETLEKFNAIISWKPPRRDICPSSIAKYLSDMGYIVKVSTPVFSSHTTYSVKVPLKPLEKRDKDDVLEFVEWLGMIALEGDLDKDDPSDYISSYITPEPNMEMGQVRCLRYRGLFEVYNVKKIIGEYMYMRYNETTDKPWIAIYVQGFSDSPVSWSIQESHYYTNGDNGYCLIFNKLGGLICSHSCSRKRYK